ncbi:MAG: DUF4214 domain-containing protein [Betaproteobacteria bacterium]|nr:DUF4214 domain-containing protein [Betaproteobacteria bacterium]
MYQADVSSVTNTLSVSNPTVFSDSTISQILALSTRTGDATVSFESAKPDASGNVTVSSGAEVVFISSSDTLTTTIKPPVNAPVVVFQGRGGVIATLNDGVTVPSGDQSRVDRVVVGSAGGDKIIVQDAKNTQVILGSGNSTITTGGGVDTVEAGLGNSTITGGSGDYAVVKLGGSANNYQVTTQNGHAIVTNEATGKVTEISKIQYVQLDNGNALVFANNSLESSVANLYRTAMGRDADAGGLDYWFDLAKGGATLDQISKAFTSTTEFTTAHAGQTDDAFVQSLYQTTFNRAGEDAGVAYWKSLLASGKSKADIIKAFAEIATQNQQKVIATEAEIVGQVTIVTGII